MWFATSNVTRITRTILALSPSQARSKVVLRSRLLLESLPCSPFSPAGPLNSDNHNSKKLWNHRIPLFGHDTYKMAILFESLPAGPGGPGGPSIKAPVKFLPSTLMIGPRSPFSPCWRFLFVPTFIYVHRIKLRTEFCNYAFIFYLRSWGTDAASNAWKSGCARWSRWSKRSGKTSVSRLTDFPRWPGTAVDARQTSRSWRSGRTRWTSLARLTLM